MKGHLRPRGKRDDEGRCPWELKFDLGRDPATGRRRIRYHSFRGTKREALVKLRELMGTVDKASYVEPSKITLAEFLRKRLAQWEASGGITPRTLERYRELVNHQIAPHLGARLLQKLKPLDIEQWHSTLKASGRKDGKGGVAARTIGHAHRVLSKALDEAVKNDIVHKNVAALQDAPAVEADEISIVPPDRVGDIVTKLRGRSSYAAMVTALFTGMRCGELLALRWNCVDLDGKLLQVREALEETKAGGIRFKAPKTRAGRREITMPDVVVDTLRAHRKAALEQRVALGLGKLPDDALVFPAAGGGPQSPQALSKAWRRAAADLSLDGVTLHALRHTHASQLIEAGVDIVTISRRLGHASPNVTLGVYAHLFQKRDDKAAAAINGALAGL